MTAVIVFSTVVTGIVAMVAVAARRHHLDDLTRD
ncbi:hypothetical protein H4W30_000483 [Amycolatopsis roodepoortensis]|uniref:Uncharacterized protein n=1 Tax=Amycolatopsis roodepoortensis TaxID=700274 RepID=A0ABR9KYL0_9PSEU|nr:hypothetical protein [Amycolatopsis roodepoortensis]